MTHLPAPPSPVEDPEGVVAWVGRHLQGAWSGPLSASPRFRGGMTAATTALQTFDVTGYAGRRNEVWPPRRRGSSALSPWIRHGLLPLPAVWESTSDGPPRDVTKFHDELLWQEYARHVYARLGRAIAAPLRARRDEGPGPDPWPSTMACMALTVTELEGDGWLVNQTRMWLASQWSVRHGRPWREGEDRFFRHLLDGSRAANRLGWQWTIGTGTGRTYGFSRWQVEKRAPGVCGGCDLRHSCPIQSWPDESDPVRIDADPRLRADPDVASTAGPDTPEVSAGTADAVWLTAESLGDDDPALVAHPELPAVFVFDEPLLRVLQLSAKRLVFLAETIGEMATTRPVEVHLGDPVEVLSGRALAATFTPVPGWRDRRARLDVVEQHPWPWLRRPGPGPVGSFSAWRGASHGRSSGRGRPRSGRAAL